MGHGTTMRIVWAIAFVLCLLAVPDGASAQSGAAGAVRCQTRQGEFWCAPGQTCDFARMACAEGRASGARRCDFSRGPVWCPADQGCDYRTERCVARSVVRPGERLCPDGVTTCPAGMQCNPAGPAGGQSCIAPGALRCDFSRGPVWCPADQGCDYRTERCVARSVVRPGERLCPDGMTTCPAGTQCNPAGPAGGQSCIAPGARRCDFSRGPVWCAADEGCDYRTERCVARSVVRPGERLCPDGVTTCPAGMQCNPAGPAGGQSCIAPGARRCDFSRGPVWCAADEGCDYRTERCVARSVVRPGERLCPDGVTTCPAGTQCNPAGPVGGQSCIAPGARRCDFSRGPVWCAPDEDCDDRTERCVARGAESAGGTINVLAATYGLNCAGFTPTNGTRNAVFRGNATGPVAGACNGRASCSFTVRVEQLGDPAYGCAKNFDVDYACGGAAKTAFAGAEAGYGSVVRLSCP
jgi:hypothetical protein